MRYNLMETIKTEPNKMFTFFFSKWLLSIQVGLGCLKSESFKIRKSKHFDFEWIRFSIVPISAQAVFVKYATSVDIWHAVHDIVCLDVCVWDPLTAFGQKWKLK